MKTETTAQSNVQKPQQNQQSQQNQQQPALKPLMNIQTKPIESQDKVDKAVDVDQPTKPANQNMQQKVTHLWLIMILCLDPCHPVYFLKNLISLTETNGLFK